MVIYEVSIDRGLGGAHILAKKAGCKAESGKVFTIV